MHIPYKGHDPGWQIKCKDNYEPQHQILFIWLDKNYTWHPTIAELIKPRPDDIICFITDTAGIGRQSELTHDIGEGTCSYNTSTNKKNILCWSNMATWMGNLIVSHGPHSY